MNIKELSEQAEIQQYANCPSSGRGNLELTLELKSILPELKQISIRKPFAMIVGSMATQGKSNNDIDIVIRGEDLSDKVKEAISFRLYRLFSKILQCPYDDTPKYLHLHFNNAGSYTSYIPIYELNLVPVKNLDTIYMSKIPFDLRGNIKFFSKDETNGKRIIAGYANVAVVDSEEQFIPIETLKKGIDTLLLDPYYSNLMLVHQSIQIGRIIEGFGDYKTHVDEKGLFIVCEIRQDLETANEIWDSILNGDINGFSIGCEVLKSHEKCDEKKCVEILDEIHIFEVSVCTDPVNEESGFVVVSKSKVDVCNECNIENDEMKTKTVSKAETPKEEEKKDAEITPIDQPVEQDKFSEIERRINALETLINETKISEEEIPPEDKSTPEENANLKNVEDLALFMLDYIINNPKSSAQDIAKAWIESKKLPPAKKPEEEEEEEEAPPEKPKEDKPKEDENYPNPKEPSKYPYPEKMSEAIGNLNAVVDRLTKLADKDELKLAIKARDDQINALELQIKTLSKSNLITEDKGEPKTVKADEEVTLEKDNPIKIERGSVYFKE